MNIEEFIASDKNSITLDIPDNEIRSSIHETCRKAGIFSRTLYVKELNEIMCNHCDKYSKVIDPINEYSELSEMTHSILPLSASSFTDYYVVCEHCQENIYYDLDDVEENEKDFVDGTRRFKFKWRSTGNMLLMKKLEEGYQKNLSPGYSYRKKYK